MDGFKWHIRISRSPAHCQKDLQSGYSELGLTLKESEIDMEIGRGRVTAVEEKRKNKEEGL